MDTCDLCASLQDRAPHPRQQQILATRHRALFVTRQQLQQGYQNERSHVQVSRKACAHETRQANALLPQAEVPQKTADPVSARLNSRATSRPTRSLAVLLVFLFPQPKERFFAFPCLLSAIKKIGYSLSKIETNFFSNSIILPPDPFLCRYCEAF